MRHSARFHPACRGWLRQQWQNSCSQSPRHFVRSLWSPLALPSALQNWHIPDNLLPAKQPDRRIRTAGRWPKESPFPSANSTASPASGSSSEHHQARPAAFIKAQQACKSRVRLLQPDLPFRHAESVYKREVRMGRLSASSPSQAWLPSWLRSRCL